MLEGTSQRDFHLLKGFDTSQYPDKAMAWAARAWAAEKVNAIGVRFSAVGSEIPMVHPEKSYAQIFKLHQPDPIHFGDFKNPSEYKAKVAKNFRRFHERVQNGIFFEGITPSSYFKETVYRGNINPIAKSFKGIGTGHLSTIGSGLAHTFGLGILAYDVMDETRSTYQEEGFFSAAKTCILKTVKNLAAWESALIGFTFGKALLPSLGCVPLGGILAGTAVSIGLSRLLNTVLPTGKSHHQYQTEGQKMFP